MPGWDSRHWPVANKHWVPVFYHQQLLGSVPEFADLEIHAIHTQVLAPAILSALTGFTLT